MDSSYFMPEEELFTKHPLPWKHQVLMIVDANGREVIHLGGTNNTRGGLLEGHMLCTLAAFIVETANTRAWGKGIRVNK